MSDKIRDKISKLLNMTAERGATEDEAETAMRLAAALAASAGIDLNTLRPAGSPKIKATSKRETSPLKYHQALLAEAAALIYGVHCDVYNYGEAGFRFVGRESNIELAQEMMFWLFRQVEEVYKHALPKGLDQRARAEFRKTFKAACALRVRERAQDVIRNLKRDGVSGEQNALVTVGYFEELRSEVQEYFDAQWRLTPEQEARRAQQAAAARKWREDNPELAAAQDAKAKKEADAWAKREARNAKKRKGTQRGRSMPRGSGTHVGYAAGNSVKLNKEVK